MNQALAFSLSLAQTYIKFLRLEHHPVKLQLGSARVQPYFRKDLGDKNVGGVSFIKHFRLVEYTLVQKGIKAMLKYEFRTKIRHMVQSQHPL